MKKIVLMFAFILFSINIYSLPLFFLPIHSTSPTLFNYGLLDDAQSLENKQKMFGGYHNSALNAAAFRSYERGINFDFMSMIPWSQNHFGFYYRVGLKNRQEFAFRSSIALPVSDSYIWGFPFIINLSWKNNFFKKNNIFISYRLDWANQITIPFAPGVCVKFGFKNSILFGFDFKTWGFNIIPSISSNFDLVPEIIQGGFVVDIATGLEALWSIPNQKDNFHYYFSTEIIYDYSISRYPGSYNLHSHFLKLGLNFGFFCKTGKKEAELK
ncbi:MAG TPA: hypothetical protein PLO89_03385 [Spirochaetota bacterium]|nr:hypothetical protein [Spirochaetota bacterium]